MKQRTALLVCFGLICAGCAQQPIKPPVPKPARVDPSMQELAKAAQSAQEDLQKLTYLRNAQAQSKITDHGADRATLAQTATPSGWGRPITFTFQGPVNTLVSKLAALANYHFLPQGNWPANPPIVDVKAHGRTLVQVLRDAMTQVPNNIKLHIYPPTRTCVLSYTG